VPLFLGGFGCLVSGYFTPFLAKKIGGARRARQILGMGGPLSAAALLAISVQIVNPFLAIFAVGMAIFANDLTVPSSWGAAMDIGGRYAGSVSGGMNMGGAGGGAVAGPMAAYLLVWSDNNWNVPIYVATGSSSLSTPLPSSRS